jgi:hypothetical protein
MKVTNLSLPELDYWVARAFGITPPPLMIGGICTVRLKPFQPSTDAHWGNLIIEAQNIKVYELPEGGWEAYVDQEGGTDYEGTGPTRLIAAMRAFALWFYGPEVNSQVLEPS